MRITGHKSIKAFQAYIQKQEDEERRHAAQNTFRSFVYNYNPNERVSYGIGRALRNPVISNNTNITNNYNNNNYDNRNITNNTYNNNYSNNYNNNYDNRQNVYNYNVGDQRNDANLSIPILASNNTKNKPIVSKVIAPK